MELSDLLKEFYKKMENRYGEDVAVAISVEGDMVESLNKYSGNMFEEYTTYDIYKELLKNHTLINSTDVMVDYTKKYIQERKVDELYKAIDLKSKYKADLIRSFIRTSHLSYGKQLAKSTDENARLYFRMVDRYEPNIETRPKIYNKRIS